MKPAPGSVAWLLRHELRLSWFGAAGGKSVDGKRGPGRGAVVAFTLAGLALHGLGWVTMGQAVNLPLGDPRLLLVVTLALAACAAFMLSSAIKASVLALFERGDLDLLLSSPLPSRSIFTVRLAGVAAGSAGVYLFFLAPFAHGALLHGQWRWLGIYPALLSIAVLSACAAMLLTLGLVRVLGARRTRVVAQVIGALAGAALVIGAQLASFFEREGRGRDWEARADLLRFDGVLAADSPLWLPARAVLGEAWPLLALTSLAVAAFVLTAWRTHRFFARGLQLAASFGGTSPASASASAHSSLRRQRFGRSLFETVVVKEWRLIVRDPHLISQVLLQLLYLLPLCFVVFGKDGVHLPSMGAGLTLLASSLAGALAWIALSAEDAPDLLQVSPASTPVVRRAKLAAALMPALALVGIPLLWLVVRSPLAGLVLCFTVSGAVLGAGLIVFWCGRPGVRSNFKARGKGGFVMNMFELLHTLAWGALAWLLAAGAIAPPSGLALVGAAIALAAVVLTLGAAWFMRSEQARVM